jgi:hypothetical protein
MEIQVDAHLSQNKQYFNFEELIGALATPLRIKLS